MGGLVKGIKKVFSAVGSIVKKIWKPVLIAAAVYFTAGIALAAMPATAGFAAAMPGFGAGGIFSGAATAIGIGGADAAANVAAGAGLFGNAAVAGAATTAATVGTAAATTAEAAAPFAGLGGADTGTAALTDWGAGTAAAGEGATDLGGAGVLAAGTPQSTIDAAAGGNILNSPAATAGVTPTGTTPGTPPADKGFWGGMSSGEKAMFAATAFKGIAGLLQPGPTRAQQGLWPGGSYFGVDTGGNGTDLGAVYKNELTGSSDSTVANPSALANADQAQTAPLAAGGVAAQQTAPATQQQPSPAASAQAGAPFLPTSSAGAATAQQTTATQQDALSKSSQSNADFIQSTMDRLDPRKRNANST